MSSHSLNSSSPITIKPVTRSHIRGSLGIVFVEGVTTGRLAVLTLTDGGPASRDGTLKEGDLVYAVDGQVVVGRTLEELREIVSGPPGTECRLTMDRPSENRQFVVVLRRENIQSREEQKRLDQERLVIAETKVTQMESIRIRLETEITRLTQQVSETRSSYSSQISTLQAQLQSEQANRARLEQQLALSQSSKSSFETDQLREEVHRLRQELDAAHAKSRDTDRLKFELSAKEEMERANQALRERMNALLADSRNEAKARMEAESEVKRLNQRLQQLSEQLQATERRHTEVTSQLHSERATLERDRDAAQRELADLRAKNGVLSRDVENQEQHRSRLESDIHKLTTELHTIRKEHQSLTDRLRSDTERFLSELSTVTSERNTLERRLRETVEELTSARLAGEREKADHHSTRDALNKTGVELSTVRSHLEEMRRQLEERMSQVRHLEEWNASLNAKLTEAQGAAVTADAANKRSRMELTAARDEITRLQRELELANSEREKILLQSKETITQMEMRYKREIFEMQRQYEAAMENVVKTSVDRAAALDLELRSASEALAQRGQKERQRATAFADLIQSVQKSKQEVAEADRDVRMIMGRYGPRSVQVPFSMHASMDSGRMVSSSSVHSSRGAAC